MDVGLCMNVCMDGFFFLLNCIKTVVVYGCGYVSTTLA